LGQFLESFQPDEDGKMSKSSKLTGLAVGVALSSLMATGAAEAATSFSFSVGTRSAQAVFDIVAGNLQVTLTNTSSTDVVDPVGVLTAVFWNGGGTVSSPISALLNGGSTVTYGPTNGGDVGGEWAYKNGLSGAPGSATQGISSVGLGLYGPGDRFDTGTNLQGPTTPDGLQYGLTSAGDNLTTGNAAVTGGFALIKNSVIFTLAGTFNLATITNVWFQYGTDLSEPSFPGPRDPGGGTPEVPIPAAFPLLAAGVGLLGLESRRRRAKV
jgi:hypothetical protein